MFSFYFKFLERLYEFRGKLFHMTILTFNNYLECYPISKLFILDQALFNLEFDFFLEIIIIIPNMDAPAENTPHFFLNF